MTEGLNSSRDQSPSASGTRAEIGVDGCPFCGGEAIILSTFDRHDVENFYGNCETCDAFGPSGRNKADAIAKWNRRSSTASPA